MRFPKRVDLTGFVLEPRERSLIRVEMVGGSLLATDSALHLLGEGYARIEWWEINHVSFDTERNHLRITTGHGLMDLELTCQSLLPETVRERVTATILTSTTFAPAGQASAVIALRRRPAVGGEESFVQIDWQGAPTPAARAEAERRGRWLTECLVFSSPLGLR